MHANSDSVKLQWLGKEPNFEYFFSHLNKTIWDRNYNTWGTYVDSHLHVVGF